MKKRIISIITTIMMALTIVSAPMPVLATDGIAIGEIEGYDCEYEHNIIEYPAIGGSIYFDEATGSITDCDTTVTGAIIPEMINGVEVISITYNAFSECDLLSDIVIPPTVQSMNFYHTCSNFAGSAVLGRSSALYGRDDVTIYGESGSYIETYAGYVVGPGTPSADNYMTIPFVARSYQNISGVANINKAYGENSFDLGASAETALSYVSSNPSVATVSSDGIVTIKGIGTTDIIVAAEESFRYKAASETMSIKVGKGSQTISGSSNFAKTYGCNFFNLGASAKTSLKYSSSNPAVASVAADGTVTVKQAGSASIIVSAEETEFYKGAEKQVIITVDKKTQQINCEEPGQITYGKKPFSLGASAVTALNYSSSDPSVASVSFDGIVTVKTPGEVKIAITAAENTNYKSDTKIVSINAKLKTPTLKAKTSGKRKVKLSWSKVPGATKYEVYMYDAKKKKFVKKITKKASKRTALHKGMTKGKTYKYKVRAYRTVDGKKVYSEFSKVKKVKAK